MSDTIPRAELVVTISNRQGLHARPVLRFVDLAAGFTSSITVRTPRASADGKSPMEMMTLAAPLGTPLRILAEGEDCQAAVEALARLVNEKFGED